MSRTFSDSAVSSLAKRTARRSFQEKNAGFDRLVAGIVRQVPKIPLSRFSPKAIWQGVKNVAQPLGVRGSQQVQQAVQSASNLGQQAYQKVIPGMRRAVNAPADVSLPVATARFMARLPSNQPILSGGVKQVAKNVANLASRPFYPGLDRGVGNAVPRVADVFRTNLAKTMRGGATAATLGSWGLGTAGAVNYWRNQLPEAVTSGLLQATNAEKGFDFENSADIDKYLQHRDAVRSQVRDLLPRVAQHAVYTPENASAADKAVNTFARNVAIPQFRNDVWQSRQDNPWIYGSLDALRGVTPMGLATSLGLRSLGSPVAPDYAQAARVALEKNPKALLETESPYHRVMTSAAKPVVERAKNQMQRFQPLKNGLLPFRFGQSPPPQQEANRS